MEVVQQMLNLLNIFHAFLSIQKPYYCNFLCLDSKGKTATGGGGTQETHSRDSKVIKGTYSTGTKERYRRHSKGIKGTQGKDRTHSEQRKATKSERHIVNAKQQYKKRAHDKIKEETYGKKVYENIERKLVTYLLYL